MKYTIEEFLKLEFCGAKTRAGTPCKRKDLFINGRCKLHGGLIRAHKHQRGKRSLLKMVLKISSNTIL